MTSCIQLNMYCRVKNTLEKYWVPGRNNIDLLFYLFTEVWKCTCIIILLLLTLILLWVKLWRNKLFRQRHKSIFMLFIIVKKLAVVPLPLGCFSQLLFPRTCANSHVRKLCIIMYGVTISPYIVYALSAPLIPVYDLSHSSHCFLPCRSS